MKKHFLPPTTQRVARNTCNEKNWAIRDNTINCLNIYKDCSENILTDHIQELNYEWDTERLLETNAGSLITMLSLVGFLKSRCFLFFMTGTVGAFILQHALQGWCPPLPCIRSMGVRTAEEISNEKMVLKLLRGDFKEETDDISQILTLVERQ